MVKNIFINKNGEIDGIKTFSITTLINKEFARGIEIGAIATTTRIINTTRVSKKIKIYFITVISVFEVSSDNTLNFKRLFKIGIFRQIVVTEYIIEALINFITKVIDFYIVIEAI